MTNFMCRVRHAKKNTQLPSAMIDRLAQSTIEYIVALRAQILHDRLRVSACKYYRVFVRYSCP